MIATNGRLRWKEDLDSLGFRRGLDSPAYRRNGLSVRPNRTWCTFERRAGAAMDPLQQPSRPGLWKLVGSPRSESLCWEFHLPFRLFSGDRILPALGEETSPFLASAEWAIRTSTGEPVPGWAPPDRAEIERWIPEGAWSLQCGPFVRQGSLIHAPERLAVRFPVVHHLPPVLPASRRDWLIKTLLDSQNRWYMVRLRMNDVPGQPVVEAEVDLSGAPSSILEELFRFSLDALRWVVSWLLWPVAFLADPSVTCRALEIRQANEFRSKGGWS